MKNFLKLTALAACVVLAGCSSNSANNTSTLAPLDSNAVYNKARTPVNFNDYVQFLKRKAAGQGVSANTLNAQQNIRYITKAVELDQKQAGNLARRKNLPPLPPNPNGATNYITKHLTQAKVDKAEENYWDIRDQLQKASSRYGVQQEFILALWGMESSFGYYQGSFDVLSVLATLAFDGRREGLFSKEFINAMKMLDRNDIQRARLLGSWAGAMGQTQFMPTSYLNYAADGDGDGRKDIWTNEYDVFASIANYLHTVGWNPNLPWGVEVELTQAMDLSQSGTEKNKARSLSYWQGQGVTLKNAFEQSKLDQMSSADLWLIRPDKEVGRAFLVTNNFRTILDWNRSNYYALSVGMFADRIKSVTGM
ncbi:membrane-bound lytic murein transglycosylase B [Pasteurella langaaensis DSM 22999]|uniref:Membrane-bound lytic murein transglycosylase B n=1 Tax=Alitibacter langaaensis DSM 22999 TaxID=1122935 RepID=A0A2U0TA80_9PAST|nr:lytic murein transglycosylase [Pasteurella langaaensis]PVX40457.1 membrane-bound lytic murein transglycosylase B [Pasteurella langaaensis DSM 22999]